MRPSSPARRKSRVGSALLAGLCATCGPCFVACREIPIELNEPVSERLAEAPDDRLLRHVLVRFVHLDGRVDYAGIATEPEALDGYLDRVARTDPEALEPSTRLAFWINAYNAMFLRAVSLWHPLPSTRRVPAIDRRTILHVGGEALTLAAIRERKIFGAGDPRALFALRTGSESGPVTGREPISAAQLDSELRTRTRDFLADPKRNDLDASDGVIELSRLFDRYRDLFGSSERGIVDFLIAQRPGLRESLRKPRLVVRWKRWDEQLDEGR